MESTTPKGRAHAASQSTSFKEAPPAATVPGAPEPQNLAEDQEIPERGRGLPVLPGFREMAMRRMSQDRRRLIAGLAVQRQAARLSQTEVAARMGTSQSAVARLETGEGDVRASTLERYAAAIGCQITWQVRG